MDLIDLILVLGPLVIVPLARPLLAKDWFPPAFAVWAAAGLFAAAFVFDATGAPAVVTAPWLVLAVFTLARCTFDVVQRRAFNLLELGLLLPYGYLVVSRRRRSSRAQAGRSSISANRSYGSAACTSSTRDSQR